MLPVVRRDVPSAAWPSSESTVTTVSAPDRVAVTTTARIEVEALLTRILCPTNSSSSKSPLTMVSCVSLSRLIVRGLPAVSMVMFRHSSVSQSVRICAIVSRAHPLTSAPSQPSGAPSGTGRLLLPAVRDHVLMSAITDLPQVSRSHSQ